MAGESGILIVAETGADGSLLSITGELMSAAQGLSADLGEPISAALIGSGVGARAQDIIDLGADTVYAVDGDLFANYLNETYTPAVNRRRPAGQPTHHPDRPHAERTRSWPVSRGAIADRHRVGHLRPEHCRRPATGGAIRRRWPVPPSGLVPKDARHCDGSHEGV